MRKTISLIALTLSAFALIGAHEKAATTTAEAVDPFIQESRDGDKPYTVVEWVPADAKPQGVLAGNAFSEVETAPAAQ